MTQIRMDKEKKAVDALICGALNHQKFKKTTSADVELFLKSKMNLTKDELAAMNNITP